MQIYANGFAMAMSEDKQELVLNFVQNMPDLSNAKSDDNLISVAEAKSEPVAQLILNAKCGKTLAEMLTRLYEDEGEKAK